MTTEEKIEKILQDRMKVKTGTIGAISPVALADIIGDISDIIISNIELKIVISHRSDIEQVPHGTPLIVGEWYYMRNYNENDDFTNIGSQNQNYTYFKATGTSPVKWTTTNLMILTTTTALVFNNTGATLTVDYDPSTGMLKIKSDIDLFYVRKVFDNYRFLDEEMIISTKEISSYLNEITTLRIVK